MGNCQGFSDFINSTFDKKNIQRIGLDIIEWNVLPLAFRQNLIALRLSVHEKREYCDSVYIYIPLEWDNQSRNMILKTTQRKHSELQTVATRTQNYVCEPPADFFIFPN